MPDTYGPVEAGPEPESAVEPQQMAASELAPEEAGADLDLGLELGLAGAGYPAATRTGAERPLPAGLQARAIGRVQRQHGNFATQRLLKRPPVQRADPRDHGTHTLPNMAGQTPPEIAALRNPDTAYNKLKEVYINRGKAGVAAFVSDIDTQLIVCSEEDKEPVRTTLHAQRDRIELYGERFVTTFEGTGRSAISEMLAASDAAIKQQMEQYGITETFEDNSDLQAEVATGDYTMKKDPKADEMAAAAKDLGEKHSALVDLKMKIAQRTPPDIEQTMGERIEQVEKAAFQDPEFIDANQKYEQVFASAAAKFPILAAFKDDPQKMATIGAQGASPATATIIGKTLKEKQKNIKETQENLDGGKLNVWSLPNIVRSE